MTKTVIVVGGGLAGLRCSRVFHESGVNFELLEAEPSLGGRVRTKTIDGFRLDRGFQVLLTGYPEVREVFDYEKLDLRTFYPGARTYDASGGYSRLTNPLRKPIAALADLLNGLPVRITDVPALLRLFYRSWRGHQNVLNARTTEEFLRNLGVSDRMLDRFFRPFFGGVFLDRSLEASPEFFLFLLKHFATSSVAVPNQGMQRLVDQLMDPLPSERIRTNCTVESVTKEQVVLDSGETLRGDAVVVACDDHSPIELDREQSYRTCRTLYFSSASPPHTEPILCLNGGTNGLVNNVTTMSQVAPGYAPRDKDLISVTILDSSGSAEHLDEQVLDELESWFGENVRNWEHLETMSIDRALPVNAQRHPNFGKGYSRRKGVYYCGDHLTTPSINGALRSGRECGEALVETLG